MRRLRILGLFLIAFAVIACANYAAAVETTFTFQEGVNHGQGTYNGVVDTYVDQHNPTYTYGDDPTLIAIDGPSAGSPRLQQPLIRFENIFGTESYQVPVDATAITAATLTLYTVTDTYGGVTKPEVTYGLYPMLASWDETATFNQFGVDGIQPDGVDAEATALGWTPNPIYDGDPVTFDVTSSLQAWFNGSKANLGWLVHDTYELVGDRWTTASSDYSVNVTRPKLEITFEGGTIVDPPNPNPGAPVDTYIGNYDGLSGTDLSLSDRLGVMGVNTQGIGMQALMRFESLDDELAAIPEGAGIDSATLSIQTGSLLYDGTSTSTVIKLHRLLQPFDEHETWDSSFGGDGVQPDGIEAFATADVTYTGGVVDGELVEFDVSNSLQAWLEGEANYGWVIMQETEGSNRWYFLSSESDSPPVLEYTYTMNPTPPLPGDANKDGKVDDEDAATLASNWLQEDATWYMGDFNGDHVVNDIDATMLATNWQVGASAAVPEPSVLALLALCLAALCTWKGRR